MRLGLVILTLAVVAGGADAKLNGKGQMRQGGSLSAFTGTQREGQKRLPLGMSESQMEDRVFQREKEEIAAIVLYKPIIETYIQELQADQELGLAPKADEYHIGLADFGRDKYESMQPSDKIRHFLKEMRPRITFDPAGFMENVFVDRYNFTKENYELEFRKKVFLGEVRCLEFDVRPRMKKARWRFVGRIWVEDQDFTIVRINGKHNLEWSRGYYPHFDTWRANVAEGVWLPSTSYSEEATNMPWRQQGPSFRSQTKFWRYRKKSSMRKEEFAKIVFDANQGLNEDSTAHDHSPLQAARAFRGEGERNVLELLEENGLLAAPGPVDKVLDTIINNLEVSANLGDGVDLHARVLMTSSFDCFVLNKTIVISRGLIDVLPDEATLAMVLAQFIAIAMEPDPYFERFAFNDLLRLSPTEIIQKLSFAASKEELQAQQAKTVEIIRKSPYAANVSTSALFFKQLNLQAKALRQLVRPSLGNTANLADELMANSAELKVEDVKQRAALPMGSRIRLDPWTDELTLIKTQPILLNSAREKLPFEITPAVPWMTRAVGQNPKVAGDAKP